MLVVGWRGVGSRSQSLEEGVLSVAHLELDGLGEIAVVVQDAELDVAVLRAPGEVRAGYQ